MSGPREYHIELSKSEKNKYYIISLITVSENNTNISIYKTEMDSQTQKKLMVTRAKGREKDKLGYAITAYIHYYI